ncbi:hypothetical protein ABZP36_017220 [Zizania latifolia]
MLSNTGQNDFWRFLRTLNKSYRTIPTRTKLPSSSNSHASLPPLPHAKREIESSCRLISKREDISCAIAISRRAAACGALILQTTAAAAPVSRNVSVDQSAGQQRRKAVAMTAAAAERSWTGRRSTSPSLSP